MDQLARYILWLGDKPERWIIDQLARCRLLLGVGGVLSFLFCPHYFKLWHRIRWETSELEISLKLQRNLLSKHHYFRKGTSSRHIDIFFVLWSAPQLSAAHSANSTLSRPSSHWRRGWRQIGLIGRFTTSTRSFARTTTVQWQSADPDSSFQAADGAHCVRDGPFRCVWEIFQHWGVHEIRRFVILGSEQVAAVWGRWGSLMEYWQIRLSARFDRGENQSTPSSH